MRVSKMAVAGVALMFVAFGVRYLPIASGLGLDIPFGIIRRGRGYVLPLPFIFFWLFLVLGLVLAAVGVYRGRAR
jgi:hypothetical protein